MPQCITCDSAGKESVCNARDLGSIPGLGRSPGEGKGLSLQYSGLENSTDYTVHGVAKSWTQLNDFHSLHWETRGWWPSAWARVDKCLVCQGVLEPLEVASAGLCWSRSNSPWHLPVAPCWDPPDSPLLSGLPGFWRKSWGRAPEDEGWADSGASCGCRQCTGWPQSPSRGLTRGHC